MVAPFDDFTRNGGTQAGRVLLYAAVQGALDEGSRGNNGQAGWYSGRSGSNFSGNSGSRHAAASEMTALSGRERSGSLLRFILSERSESKDLLRD